MLETKRSGWKKKFPMLEKTVGLEKKTFEVGNHTFGFKSWKNVLGWN